jgi:hypothetical protein
MSYNASKNIESSVDKLEKIYDVLLNKVFGMVGDTLADYRKHAWSDTPPEEDLSKLAEEKADKKIADIKSEISKEIEAKIAKLDLKTRKTDFEISDIKNSMEELLEKAITASRHVEEEAVTETLENKVLTSILDLYRLTGKSEFPVDSLLDYLLKMSKITIDAASFLKTLIYLRDNGLILLPFGVYTWNDIFPTAFVELTSEGVKKAEEIKTDTYTGKYTE